MQQNNLKFGLALCIPLMFSGVCYAQGEKPEIMTLFTTQQERSLIDSNRYRNTSVKVKKPVVQDTQAAPEPERKVSYKEEVLTLRVSGITLSEDGTNVAWVNGQAYENGSQLENGSKVYINRKASKPVKIKTPDGKFHSLQTGESSELTYLVPEGR